MLANLKKITKMKTRSFVLLIVLIILTTTLVWFFNLQTSYLARSLVSETQHHIQSINSKLKVLDQNENLEVDSTYLELLGFVKDPTLFKSNNNNNKNNNNVGLDDLINNNNNNEANNDVILVNSRIPPLVTAFQRFTEKEKALIESKLR
jgi:hypothetical protein